MQISNLGRHKSLLLGVTLSVLVVAPFVVFGGGHTLYVNKSQTGSEDGSKDHPYNTINEALKRAKNGDDIVVAKGTYKENITLPKEVSLRGAKKNHSDVTIEAKDDDKPAVEMKHGSELSFLTIKGGRHGVRILEDSKAHLYDLRITSSERDGIHVDSANVSSKKRVLIDKVEIEKSDRSGIYSEKRLITVINSDIHDNRGDGIDLAAGTHAWFEDSTFNENRGSGAKLILDGASIWSKSNEFKGNHREGIEISSFGGQGTIGFKRAKVSNNDRYGVAYIGRTAAGMKMFGNVGFGLGINGSSIQRNGLGNISPVLFVK